MDAGERARSLERARKLVALDRALIEIGEPGVLEREPADLASLEARLFGPPKGAIPADPAGAAPSPARPELRLIAGALEDRRPSDPDVRAARKAKLTLLERRP